MLIDGEPLVELGIEVERSLGCSEGRFDEERGGCGAGEAIRDEVTEDEAGEGEEL